MSGMTILQYITPSGIGGAERHFLSLCLKLQERGHRVIAVCPRGRPLTVELRAAGVRLHAPRTIGKADPVMVGRLIRLIRRKRIDLVHTHLSTASLLGAAAARVAGVPCLATVHGLNHRFCFRFADRLIAVSRAVRDHLVAQGEPADRIEVIHNGIDLGLWRGLADQVQARSALGLPPRALVVGSVGRLSPEKGHAVLVEAAAGLPGVHLLLVGDGRERSRLHRLALRLGMGDRVTLAGFLPDTRTATMAMDVFALPSLREGLSISLLEAMAAGKPVIASRVGGVPEAVLEGQTGLLVPPGDAASLAAAIRCLLLGQELRLSMGKAGEQRAKEVFDLKQMVDRSERVYRMLKRAANS